MVKKIFLFLFLSLFMSSFSTFGYLTKQQLQNQRAEGAAFNALFMGAIQAAHTPLLSIYWCGPDAGCGGQSKDFSDINPKATDVFIAFAQTNSTGQASFSLTGAMSKKQFINDIAELQAAGKKVLLSIGGQGADWSGALAHPQNFANSVYQLLKEYYLDGVDLDIESSSLATSSQAEQLIVLIHDLRTKFNIVKTRHLLITVTPESTTVAKTVPSIGGGWNAMVPVIDLAIQYIDFIQVQAYNDNPLGDTPGTAAYLINIYNGWVKPFKLAQKDPTTGVSQYNGLAPSKLLLGVPASEKAANSQYYVKPDIFAQALSTLKRKYGRAFGGVMLWDSHWDKLNQYKISNTVAWVLY